MALPTYPIMPLKQGMRVSVVEFANRPLLFLMQSMKWCQTDAPKLISSSLIAILHLTRMDPKPRDPAK